MTTVTISLPEDVKALAEARASQFGHSLEDYLANLIRADAGLPIDEGLEQELLAGLESPSREFSPAAWAEKKRRFEERQGAQ